MRRYATGRNKETLDLHAYELKKFVVPQKKWDERQTISLAKPVLSSKNTSGYSKSHYYSNNQGGGMSLDISRIAADE